MGPAGDALDRLLTASPSLRDALPGIERAAATDAAVLILGEPGTGRSTLARALHAASGRHDGPLVEMDPGVVPAALFEGDLFGHRAGAFTGADQDVAGRIERAEGGTLVLDHVEELPVRVQPKLLRVLAERRFAPLGGLERSADVRFVALGPPDLAERAQRGSFRADLFYRLDVLSYLLPPLRRRVDDLSQLLDAVLADLAARLDRPKPILASSALDWMLAYAWPGNLRQMRNVLERAMVVADGDVLDPEPPGGVERRPPSLREVEKAHLLKVLAYTRGHQGRAAEILGISRKALWEKRRRLGIP
ncbi:MAG: sigma 54-interacting transcriptional regulator [Acidobacteriota bacterium]